MKPFSKYAYFYCGSIAVILSWTMATLLTGCRFGNHSSQSITNGGPSDPVTGYYDASPQSLRFCATGSASRCNDVATTQIPGEVGEEMSNPVALILVDAQNGEAALTSAFGDGTTALPIWVGADNVLLYYVSSSNPQTLWRDSKCTITTYLHEDGSIVPGPGHTISGTNSRTVGSLTLKIQVVRSIEGALGACVPELASMRNCYQDVTQCGGTDSGSNAQYQARVRGLFEAYISAGALTPAEIADVANVSYEVRYQ